jgi:hypothetical protein
MFDFSGLTVEQIKIKYKKLAMQYHPDLGGDLEIMKMLNNAYEAALKSCDGQKTKDDQGQEHTYKYSQEIEQALMNKIIELLSLNMEDVDIDLIGTWIWVTGNTKPFKDKIKQAGCTWHSKRGCWYFKIGKYYGKSSTSSLEELAKKYGCTNASKFNKNIKVG